MSDGEPADIKHARTCDECGAETFQFERCHNCGDIPWKSRSARTRERAGEAIGDVLQWYLREFQDGTNDDPVIVPDGGQSLEANDACGYGGRCPECDRRVSLAARYCQWCGEPLDEEDER